MNPVANAMRFAAHQLAAEIEHGYEGLTDCERGDLRMLPCDLLKWADEIDPDGAAVHVPPRTAVLVQFPQLRVVGSWA